MSTDLLSRPRLLEYLDRSLAGHRLTLLTAPAGYGKSVLVSQWVGQQQRPCAWLSLDESDSELRRFTTYLVAAIETAVPHACPSTRDLVLAPRLPPVSVITRELTGELDACESFILVLDDYQCIDPSSSVHELVGLLLKISPPPLHLVLAARCDPPLPAALLWGGNAVDIRLQDLRFTPGETAEVLERAGTFALSEQALANLEDTLEGWPIGLRMLCLELRHTQNPEAFVKNLRRGIPHAQDYLLQEVLARQGPAMRRGLLTSSILDRFCAESLDAVWAVGSGATPFELGGEDFIERLERHHLFTIPLDDRGTWFRYHHLFQEFLLGQLQRETAASEVAAIHCCASAWFEANGLIDEAIRYAMDGGDPERAADVVARHRLTTLEQQGTPFVERWLDRLPKEVRHKRPDLMLAELFELGTAYRLWEMAPLIDTLESLEAKGSLTEQMVAELDMYRGEVEVWLHCNGEVALKRLESAKARGRLGSGIINARLERSLAVARLMTGDSANAVASLEEQVRSVDPGNIQLLSRQTITLGTVRLLTGELEGAIHDASRAIEAAGRHGIADIEGWGLYLRANAELQAYRLSNALADFQTATQKRKIFDRRPAIDAFTGLALVYQALHRSAEATSTLEELTAFARETGAAPLLTLAESSRARLALLQGDVGEALRWADSFGGDVLPSDTFFYVEVPILTQSRAWIASGTPEALGKALARLSSLRETFGRLHFTPQEIEVITLQALALEKQGRPVEAQTSFRAALALAAPRGFARPFVEAGWKMAGLLERTPPDYHRFIQLVLAAFDASPVRSDSPGKIDPSAHGYEVDLRALQILTHREIDVLELLAKRLRDKEIAEKLSISTHTVKDHLKHIYQKLAVRGRREAASKAASLGLFRN